MNAVKDWRGMVPWITELLVRRTGISLDEWNRRVADAGLDNAAGLRSWLGERGVTGYPQMLLVMERFGYPDFLAASAEELIDAQYADRPGLRPVLDRVLAVATGLGDVEAQARKTYVALVSPRRQFALIQPSTKSRVDLGLRLSDATPSGRLQEARSLGNDQIRLRVGLARPEDVDDEVVTLLQTAYDHNI